MKDDTEYISWYDIALNSKLWEMLTQLMSSEKLSFELKDLEDPVGGAETKKGRVSQARSSG